MAWGCFCDLSEDEWADLSDGADDALDELEGREMPYGVLVKLTIDTADPDEAIAVARAEPARKLPSDDQPWQTESHHLLPRYQVGSVRKVSRLDEHGHTVG